MKLHFDHIHTLKKQNMLSEMMEKTAADVRNIENSNPVLKACPVCQDEEIAFYVEAYGFAMSRCGGCGLLFCNPYPSELQLFTYYNSDMKRFENEFFRESFENRVKLFMPRVELIKKFKNKGKLLDVGSAIGIFIEALCRSDSQFEIACCDLNPDACKELKSRHASTQVLNADFMKLDDADKFDVITMWDTIEHLVDLNGVFQKVHSKLNKGGLFIFSTPNTHSFEWIIAGKKHVQILPPGHVNLMNLKSLQVLISNNRFKLLSTVTLNASLDISYVKKLIENNTVDTERIGLFLKEILYDADFEVMFEQYLINKRMGGNIVVVIEKDARV